MTFFAVEKNGRPAWRVTFQRDGKTTRRFFPTKAAAVAFGAAWKSQAAQLTPALLAASPWEQSQMVEALRRAKVGGYTLAEACAAVESQRATTRDTPTLAALRALFLAAKAAQRLRPRSLRGLASSTSLFIRGREAMPAGAITTTDVARFIAEPGYSAWRHRTILVDLNTWFTWGVALGHLMSNPCRGVPRPMIEAARPALHRAEQITAILRTAERLDPELVGYGAAGYFAGLRPESEMARLPRANLRADVIRIEEWNKTRRRRDVTISPNLAAWLARWRVLGCDLCPPNAARRWQAIRKAAGFAGREQDVMRHTFVSAHYVLHGEAATVAQAGHSAQELHASYRDLLSRDEAAAIFGIQPDPAADYAANAAARMAHWRRANPAHMRAMTAKRWGSTPDRPVA